MEHKWHLDRWLWTHGHNSWLLKSSQSLSPIPPSYYHCHCRYSLSTTKQSAPTQISSLSSWLLHLLCECQLGWKLKRHPAHIITLFPDIQCINKSPQCPFYSYIPHPLMQLPADRVLPILFIPWPAMRWITAFIANLQCCRPCAWHFAHTGLYYLQGSISSSVLQMEKLRLGITPLDHSFYSATSFLSFLSFFCVLF